MMDNFFIRHCVNNVMSEGQSVLCLQQLQKMTKTCYLLCKDGLVSQ